MSKTPTQIKSLARAHTETAINVLAGIMNQPDSPAAARVSAAQAILDRGWGKATQVIAGDPEAPLEVLNSPDLSKLTKEQRDNLRGIISAVTGKPEGDLAQA